MRIEFTAQDIEIALRQYIQEQGIVTEGKTVELEFVMGRKGKGLSAAANITPAASASVTPIQAAEDTETSEEQMEVGEGGSLFNS